MSGHAAGEATIILCNAYRRLQFHRKLSPTRARTHAGRLLAARDDGRASKIGTSDFIIGGTPFAHDPYRLPQGRSFRLGLADRLAVHLGRSGDQRSTEDGASTNLDDVEEAGHHPASRIRRQKYHSPTPVPAIMIDASAQRTAR